jgi:NADH:ubiquinone oxidoreductase subunit 2 (subunit N)
MAASVVSLYYYLRVLQTAYVDKPPEDASEDELSGIERSGIAVPRIAWTTLSALMVGLIVVGFWPTELVRAIESATAALAG